MAHADVAHAVVFTLGVGPPEQAARVVVVRRHDHCVVVGLEEAAVYKNVFRSADAESVAADAFDAVELKVGEVDVFAVVERRMVVVGADDLDAADLHVFAQEESKRDAVDAPVAADRVAGHSDVFLGAGVEHPDRALTGYFYVAVVRGLDERQVGGVEIVGPVDAGNDIVVAVRRLIGVVAAQL